MVRAHNGLAGGLGRFWYFRGHAAEGETWLKRALALPSEHRTSAGRAWCLFGLSMLAMSRGDYAAVERLARESRTLFSDLGNAAQEAFSLFHLGRAATGLGRYPDARAYRESGLPPGPGGARPTCCFA